jgi:hypothetical protein
MTWLYVVMRWHAAALDRGLLGLPRTFLDNGESNL